jgi:hypothetical protein
MQHSKRLGEDTQRVSRSSRIKNILKLILGVIGWMSMPAGTMMQHTSDTAWVTTISLSLGQLQAQEPGHD